MAVRFYMDAHVRGEVTEQLRLRGVDVLTAQEDGRDRTPDNELLRRAHELGRVLVTQDHRFRAMAEEWQATGEEFSGLAFANQNSVSIGQLVNDLYLIAEASEPDEWRNWVQYLPLRSKPRR